MSTNASRPQRVVLADSKFTSSLGEGRQRFLAQVIAHGLDSGRRTPKDFIRHFPPKAIMLALESQPRLRANIVVPTIGLHEKIALKKSAAALGEDLQIALDEGVTDEEAIVSLFGPDDRVRYLDDKKLWAFLAEGDFWKATAAQGAELAVAKQHLAYIVDCARANGLVTDHDVVEGLTLDRVLELLPKGEIVKVVRAAVGAGRHGQAFDDEALLGTMPPAALLDHIPLALMWESVVVPRIAGPHGFLAHGPAAREAVAPPAQAAQASPTSPPAPVPAPSPSSPDVDDIVIEIVDRDSNVGKPAPKPQKSRRIDALNLSELKSEIADDGPSKG